MSSFGHYMPSDCSSLRSAINKISAGNHQLVFNCQCVYFAVGDRTYCYEKLCSRGVVLLVVHNCLIHPIGTAQFSTDKSKLGQKNTASAVVNYCFSLSVTVSTVVSKSRFRTALEWASALICLHGHFSLRQSPSGCPHDSSLFLKILVPQTRCKVECRRTFHSRIS